MLIPVVLKDGSYEKVFSGELSRLLTKDQVLIFRRAKGWVMVGSDRMRGVGGYYFGDDRRKTTRPSLKRFMH